MMPSLTYLLLHHHLLLHQLDQLRGAHRLVLGIRFLPVAITNVLGFGQGDPGHRFDGVLREER